MTTPPPDPILPLLEMRRIVKRFPGLIALDQVDFSARAGEIHALIGQNGAGKSTLMKILAGVYTPDAGEIRLAGKTVSFGQPRDALRQGIGVVYQDLSLVPKLTVAQNIFLGREPGGAVIDERAIYQRTEDILLRLGVSGIDIHARVDSLPLAQQQLVEITRVLSYEPRILVLDEPTAALAEEETDLLFTILHRLRQEGIAIIYISHRFKEILTHCDHATVLRNGRVVSTLPLGGVSDADLIELTLGEKPEQFFHAEKEQTAAGEILVELEGVSVGRAVRSVDLTLRRGEIVGLTGLLGAGQNELARALFGLMPEVSGVIRVRGTPTLITSPRQAIALGIGLLTEHRKTEGLVLEMSVRDNITLPSLDFFRRWGIFNRSRSEAEAAGQYVERLRIKTTSIHTKTWTLSGGNQQKVILGKWLLRDLELLIFIAPTQGIDVGAKAEIYDQLRDLAAAGKAIMVVSEEMVEILGISDRVVVMYKGEISGEFTRPAISEAAISAALQGSRTGVSA
ncbi:sugar ABC transporter ATP-binding protein [Anaerolineae bacterium CFX9]|nr:sugar ABC transporter ATP-binding protein [Anaerolineae bacterium CFX9]